jgi:hypothetical protein
MPPVLAGIFGAEECVQERQRQSDDVDHGYEASTRDLPERGLRNVVAPECLPSRDGRCVGTKECRKLTHAPRRRSVPHGADQDHQSTKVDLPAEKSYRRRREPLSAAVAITAEAEPVVILLWEMIGAAPRCARVVGTVQATAARASLLPSTFRQVLVNRQEEGPETRTSMQLMRYDGVLLGLRPSKEYTPCQCSSSITFIDGIPRKNLKYLDQNPRISRRLP